MKTVIYPDLSRRHVIVTGGATGIGAAIAEAFLDQGANVSILDIAEPQPSLVNHPAAASSFRGIFCDLRNPADLDKSIETCRSHFGSVEILVNNAARDDRHTIDDADAALWDDLMAINLRAAHLVARSVMDDMTSRKDGVIINMSSNAVLMGLPDYPVYVTAKAGLMGLTKALARQFGVDNVRVNCLVPGWVMTERQRTLWATPEAVEDCLKSQCLKTQVEPYDIANACLFLASRVSRMMTGQLLVIDGGRV